MCGQLLKDWFQTSLILSPVLLSSCSVNRFKSELDSYLRNIVDLPCQPGVNKSGRRRLLTKLHGGQYADDLAAK